MPSVHPFTLLMFLFLVIYRFKSEEDHHQIKPPAKLFAVTSYVVVSEPLILFPLPLHFIIHGWYLACQRLFTAVISAGAITLLLLGGGIAATVIGM